MTLSLTAMRYGCFFSIPYHRNRCDFVAQQLGLINDYLATVGSNIYLHEGTLSQFQAFDLKKIRNGLRLQSSQDIVILLDVSGSMTGLRKEIAKHVVLNIMETLGEDDFVTVLTFSDETKPLVECFTDSDGEPELVQATTENIAEFTEAVNEIETMEIANFTSALTAAFTLLERYRTKKVRVN